MNTFTGFDPARLRLPARPRRAQRPRLVPCPPGRVPGRSCSSPPAASSWRSASISPPSPRHPRRPARERLHPAHRPRHPLLGRQVALPHASRPVVLGGRRPEPPERRASSCASTPTRSRSASVRTTSMGPCSPSTGAPSTRHAPRRRARPGRARGPQRPGRSSARPGGSACPRRTPPTIPRADLLRHGGLVAATTDPMPAEAFTDGVPGLVRRAAGGRCGRCRRGWPRWWRRRWPSSTALRGAGGRPARRRSWGTRPPSPRCRRGRTCTRSCRSEPRRSGRAGRRSARSWFASRGPPGTIRCPRCGSSTSAPTPSPGRRPRCAGRWRRPRWATTSGATTRP